MKDLDINSYPYLEGFNATEENYVAATTFGDAEIIVFCKIPRSQYGLIEEWIEEILEHETIHIVLNRLKEYSHGIDYFFPHLSALWEFNRNPVRFIREFKMETET